MNADQAADLNRLFLEHCAELRASLTGEQLAQLAATPEERLGVATHFTLAMFVRNRWLNAYDSTLMTALDGAGALTSPDDVSDFLVHLLWLQLHNRTPDAAEMKTLLPGHCIFLL